MDERAYLKCSCQNCAGHIEFPEDLVGTQIECPHCRWTTSLSPSSPDDTASSAVKGKREIQGWAVVIPFLLVLSSVVAFYSNKPKAQRVSTVQASPAVTSNATVTLKSAEPEKWVPSTNYFAVGRIKLQKAKNGSVVYAVGTLKNQAERQRFGVRVELDLLDKSGAKIGTASDYLAILEPRKIWHFKALVLEGKAASAKLGKIKEEQ